MSPVSLGNPARNRLGTAAGVFSALALVAIVPHVLDDQATGILAEDLGLSLGLRGLIIGAALAAQVLFAFGSIRERRAGHAGVLVLAGIWVVLAIVEHSGAFLPGDFAGGLSSRLAVLGVVALQGIAALTALGALRSRRRTSFSGTGSFGS